MLKDAMTLRNGGFAVGTLMLLATAGVGGHHHVGCVYDTEATQKVAGRIVEIVWKFPHVHLRLETSSSSADRAQWDIETLNPQGLRRVSVESDTLKVGDVVVTNAWIAKDGSRQAFTQSMTLPSGRTVAFHIAELSCPF